MKVSHSEVESYLLCQRKHYYGYTEGIERITTSSSLSDGSNGHLILEAYYKSIRSEGLLRRQQRAGHTRALNAANARALEIVKAGNWSTNPKRADLRHVLFDIYFANEPLVRYGWQIHQVERPFILNWGDGRQLQFKIDLIANDPDGLMKVIDHKFIWDFYTPGDIALQPQLPKYVGALRAMSFPIKGAALNMVRTRPNAREFTRLQDVPLSDQRVTRTFEEYMDVAEEIIGRRDLSGDQQERLARRVANKMVCQSCSYKDVCDPDLNGGPSSLVRRTQYRHRERPDFEEEEVIEG